jgi:hypothetical protein
MRMKGRGKEEGEEEEVRRRRGVTRIKRDLCRAKSIIVILST